MSWPPPVELLDAEELPVLDDVVPGIAHIDVVPGELFAAAHFCVLASQSRSFSQSRSVVHIVHIAPDEVVIVPVVWAVVDEDAVPPAPVDLVTEVLQDT